MHRRSDDNAKIWNTADGWKQTGPETLAHLVSPSCPRLGRMTGFQPYGTPRPCRYCHWFVRAEPHAGTVFCGHDGTLHRHAAPATGCAFWQREPGSDDDLATAWVAVAERPPEHGIA